MFYTEYKCLFIQIVGALKTISRRQEELCEQLNLKAIVLQEEF
jgi:hypothetical protein